MQGVHVRYVVVGRPVHGAYRFGSRKNSSGVTFSTESRLAAFRHYQLFKRNRPQLKWQLSRFTTTLTGTLVKRETLIPEDI